MKGPNFGVVQLFVDGCQVGETYDLYAPALALALTLGAQPTFGAFQPGVEKEYTAATTANVVSSAGDGKLTVSDPGHLINGTRRLPEPLRVDIAPNAWSEPVSNAAATIGFKQLVKANDALRTGTYTKTLTFTLSTTNP